MALLNHHLTVWELAHRLNGLDPDRWHWFGYPLPLKDSFRMLLDQILAGNLASSLILTKREYAKEPSDPEFYIRTHLDDIYACIAGARYPKKMLKHVLIWRDDFRTWCQESQHPLPEFWFAVDWVYSDPEEQGLEMENQANPDQGPVNKLRPNQKKRIACQQIAEVIWKDDEPSMTITAMIEHNLIKKYGGANYFEDETVRNWLSEVAPEGVRGRRGRRRKDGKIPTDD